MEYPFLEEIDSLRIHLKLSSIRKNTIFNILKIKLIIYVVFLFSSSVVLLLIVQKPLFLLKFVLLLSSNLMY
ncbi:hypothetical protein SRED_001741 [Spiroplasma melliferum]|uniref:Spiroplasmavirus-related protein n=1 Tax=Spiroplasma melliferum TaxID=2134 RepID=A0ABX5U7F6_SPIME|nr:hypothetical protein SRED_001741 [Spiroplasma melliferum]